MTTRRWWRPVGLAVALTLGPGAGSEAGPTAGSCPVFPDDHALNTRVDTLPVHPSSAAFISSIGATRSFHADFGSGLFDGGPIGIPFVVVPSSQPTVPVNFVAYGDESDPGPYPIPLDAPIEGGAGSTGDRHVLAVKEGECTLYELYRAFPQAGSWDADSGAVYALGGYALRTDGFTSADAAGLPIFPLLVRREEVEAGEILHAIRFTAQVTRRAHVWPARHDAGSTDDPNVPPMGQRFRMKASKDISGFPAEVQVIFRAMKRYGLILADNGSNWFVSGAPDPAWDNDMLNSAFGQLRGSDFEAVDVSALIIDPNTAQAAPPPPLGPFDGDGRADVAVYRGTTGQWLVSRSDGGESTITWGDPALLDVPISADFDGDGGGDIAVYRGATGQWFVLRSGGGVTILTWGDPAVLDVPVAADFDGDGRADIAVYRRTTGQWFVLNSGGGATILTWGDPALLDVPAPADYDGDGRADIAVYRGATGQWFVLHSGGGVTILTWGDPALLDVPVPGRYDPDGRADIAVYRTTSGQWFVLGSAGGVTVLTWGAPPLLDVPVPADYDGDGRTDIAVYRASTGDWFALLSGGGVKFVTWGDPALGDLPRPLQVP